jgi:hypothetical protein
MSHLQKLAYILGSMLVGVSTYLIVSSRKAAGRSRRNSPPVQELAHNLQEAWSAYHNR